MKQDDRYSKEEMLKFRLMMNNLDPRPEHNLNYVKQQAKINSQNTQDKK